MFRFIFGGSEKIKLLPKTIFRYRAINAFTEEFIEDNRLYFANYPELNDPMEGIFNFKVGWDRTKAAQNLHLIREMHRDGYRATEVEKANAGNPGLGMFKDALRDRGDEEILRILEFGAKNMDESQTRAMTEAMIQAQSNTAGLCCFSEDGQSPYLSWYYGEMHQGLVMEFSTSQSPFNKLHHVSYGEEMPSIYVFDSRQKVEEMMFFYKYKDWAAEREWRIVNHIQTEGKFVTIPPEALISIAFCPRASVERRAMVEAALERRQKKCGHRPMIGELRRSSDGYRFERIAMA